MAVALSGSPPRPAQGSLADSRSGSQARKRQNAGRWIVAVALRLAPRTAAENLSASTCLRLLDRWHSGDVHMWLLLWRQNKIKKWHGQSWQQSDWSRRAGGQLASGNVTVFDERNVPDFYQSVMVSV